MTASPGVRLMAAAVDGRGSAFEVGAVRPLFDVAGADVLTSYDVSADGQRFLINMPVERPPSLSITLVVNWPALLEP